MDLSGLFILANDVEFIPVDSIAEKTKTAFGHEDDDVVITQVKGRGSSKVISKDLAGLLQEFRSPKSFADVIYFFSTSQQKDPQQLAEEVFASLVNMKEWGFIIPYDLNNDPSEQVSLKSGETFIRYTIVKNLRSLSDTEVCSVKDSAGNMFALKLLKASNAHSVIKLFNNEKAILQSLDGLVNPKLIEEGSEGDNKFLISSWCEGITCIAEATKYRNTNSRAHVIKLLNLGISVLKAYQHLHQQKVLHGDVNPDNVLVSSSGEVKIIDYGYAVVEGNPMNIGRAGTGFYYEPEFATSFLENGPKPALTEKAEQYSIAVLLYYLIAGQHYLDFSFEKDKLYKQVAYDEPLSFMKYDLVVPVELDHVMRTALAKEPKNRFASLKDFVTALVNVRDKLYESNRHYIFNKQNTEQHIITFLQQKFGWDSPFIEKGLSLSPNCSVNYGSAGIAYMFYRMSCVQESAALSDLADVWMNRALSYKDDDKRAFHSAPLEITEKVVGKRSLYHSPVGIYLVQSLISNSRNNSQSLYHGVQGFLRAASVPCEKIDLTLGRAGLLVGCSLLFKELLSIKDYPTTEIVSFAESMKNEIWKQLDEYPPVNASKQVEHVGMAHGWSGLLYATLLWCDTANTGLPTSFMKRLEELFACSIQEENKICWPYSVKDNNPWTGWCSGTAGHVFLWVLLYKYFKEEKYIRIAVQAGNHLINSPLINNVDLCCGMSGVVYSMMNLYKVTNEDKYFRHAQQVKQSILEKWHLLPMRNNSLYKGEVGVGILLSEMSKTGCMRMPLFE